MSELQNVIVPNLGDFQDIPVIGILVEPDAKVTVGDPLIELESDKATMDIPAPFSGTIVEIKISLGDRVSPGDLILTALASEKIEPELATASSTVEDKQPQPPIISKPLARSHRNLAYAGPSVRKYARELGVDLNNVPASGQQGRILRQDIQSFVRGRINQAPATNVPAVNFVIDLPAWPEPEHASFGPIQEAELSRIQKISAGNLARNWTTIPHVTNFDKSDVTETEAYRKALNVEHANQGVKLTMLAFMMKAAVAALKAYPRFNVSFARGKLIQKNYFHIGFAADTPNGLVVAVVRDCDSKGLISIANEIRDLAGRARAGKLTSAEMSGGCFTVSSLGGIGGTGFTPIINAPEVAILGAGRAEIQPVWTGSETAPRLIQPLALSWDHRAVDGAAAARFLAHLTDSLANVRQMVM